MKKADIAIGLYILAAIVFLIVPLPSFLLDILMAMNISIALIVLFNALYAKEALDMSSFPTILLFTTVFRIGRNRVRRIRWRWRFNHWHDYFLYIDYYTVCSYQ